MITVTRIAAPRRAVWALRVVVVAALMGIRAMAAAAPPLAPPPSAAAGPTRVARPSLMLPTTAPPEDEPPPSGAQEPSGPSRVARPSLILPTTAPPEYEPPPSAWPPPLPAPLKPPPSRVYFELGLAGTALVSRGVYGFGGGLDLGARGRLPFGALGIALRLGLEQHVQPEPAPFLLNLGVAVTYLIARPHWRVGPYLGVWAQGLLQRTPDAIGAIPLQRNEGGLTLGGLAGAQLRLGRGGIFTELGYRQTVYRQTAAVFPAWNVVQLGLGYRFTTN